MTIYKFSIPNKWLIVTLLVGIVLIGSASYFNYLSKEDISNSSIGPAFESFGELTEKLQYLFDDDGIRLYKYGDIGLQYNPVSISQYAQLIFKNFYSEGVWGDLAAEKIFFANVDWLVENQDKNTGVWYYEFSIWDLKAPWVSAMAQGEAVNALVFAYKAAGDEKYIVAARNAVKPFDVPEGSGGVLGYIDGLPFYEEYPNSYYDRHTLNGFIFSLFGLYNLYKVTRDVDVLNKFNAGVDTLIAKSHLWEEAKGTAYSLGKNRKFKYHQIHVNQLAKLYDITGNSFFKKKAIVWDAKTGNRILIDRFSFFDRFVARFGDRFKFPPGFYDLKVLFGIIRDELALSK